MNVHIWLNEDYSLKINTDPDIDDIVVDMEPADIERYKKVMQEYRSVQEMLSSYRKIQTHGVRQC